MKNKSEIKRLKHIIEILTKKLLSDHLYWAEDAFEIKRSKAIKAHKEYQPMCYTCRLIKLGTREVENEKQK